MIQVETQVELDTFIELTSGTYFIEMVESVSWYAHFKYDGGQ